VFKIVYIKTFVKIILLLEVFIVYEINFQQNKRFCLCSKTVLSIILQSVILKGVIQQNKLSFFNQLKDPVFVLKLLWASFCRVPFSWMSSWEHRDIQTVSIVYFDIISMVLFFWNREIESFEGFLLFFLFIIF
jgi:hypothetical protein